MPAPNPKPGPFTDGGETGPPPGKMPFLRRRRFPLFLLAIGLIAYSNALSGEYCYDDIFLIRDRKTIESAAGLRFLVSRQFGPAFGDLHYRPIAPLTFFVDALVFGKQPAFSRLINIALHLAVGLGLFGLWRRLFRRDDLALLAAVVFLCHPLASEVVNAPGFRKDLLALLPTVGVVALLWRCAARRSVWAGWAAAALWGIGLLAKEPAFMAPALALVVILYARRTTAEKDRGTNSAADAKQTLRLWGAVAAAFVCVFAVWLALYVNLRPEMTFDYEKFASTKPAGEVATGSLGPVLGFFNFCRAAVVYARLWLLPVGLSIHHYFEPSTSCADARIWFAGLLFLAFGALAVRAFLRGHPAGVGGLWACLAFAPIAQIIPAPEWIAERYVYPAHAGIALLIASLALGCPAGTETAPARAKQTRLAAGFALVVVYMGLTLYRNEDWRDDLTLNIRAYELWDNEEGRVRLGTLHYLAAAKQKADAGRRAAHLTAARRALSRALEENPARDETWRILGGILWEQGERDAARAHWRKAFELDPENPLNRNAMKNAAE